MDDGPNSEAGERPGSLRPGWRRVAAAGLGLLVVALGAYLLVPQPMHQRGWTLAMEEEGRLRVALLVDTRGAPLAVESDHQGSRPEGRAGPGFRLAGSARAGPGPMTVRLVDPTGKVAWTRRLAGHAEGELPPTTLEAAGIWRLEFRARQGNAAFAEVSGTLPESRWTGAAGGSALPVLWIAAGALALVALRWERAGRALAGAALLAVGVSAPVAAFLLPSYDERLGAYPPGEAAMVAFTFLLVAGGSLVLGWSRPSRGRRGARPRDAVLATAGALAAVALYVAYTGREACVENPCLPQELVDDLLILLGLAADAAILAFVAYRLGRRTASRRAAVPA